MNHATAPLLQATEVILWAGLPAPGMQITLFPGETVGIIGANGAGKSTLLYQLAGLARRQPRSLVLQGTPLTELSPRQQASRRTYMAQQWPRDIAYSVYDLVALAWSHHRADFAATAPADVVLQALQQVGLSAHRDVAFAALSGGEQQRVWLAQALCANAPIWLLDEPTAHLDLQHQHNFMQLLQRRNAAGQATLLSLHDLSLAALLCQRLLILTAGTLLCEGTPQEVLQAAQLAAAFQTPLLCLTHPRTQTPVVTLA